MALAIAPTAEWGWPEEIGRSLQLRQRLHAVEGDLSPFAAPFVGASEERLGATQARLGRPLDLQHRDLLAHADGWEHFFTYTHLLPSVALGRREPGTLAGDAGVVLDRFFQGGSPVPDLPERSDLLVIAANPAEVPDLLVLWLAGPTSGGGRPVSWLAGGEEVDRFDTVWQLLVSVDAYLEQDLDRA